MSMCQAAARCCVECGWTVVDWSSAVMPTGCCHPSAPFHLMLLPPHSGPHSNRTAFQVLHLTAVSIVRLTERVMCTAPLLVSVRRRVPSPPLVFAQPTVPASPAPHPLSWLLAPRPPLPLAPGSFGCAHSQPSAVRQPLLSSIASFDSFSISYSSSSHLQPLPGIQPQQLLEQP